MDKVRATVISNDAGMKLIAIESVECTHIKTESSYRFIARIEPIAVVVHDGRGVYALDMSAQAVVLKRLERDVPGLAQMLYEGGQGDS